MSDNSTGSGCGLGLAARQGRRSQLTRDNFRLDSARCPSPLVRPSTFKADPNTFSNTDFLRERGGLEEAFSPPPLPPPLLSSAVLFDACGGVPSATASACPTSDFFRIRVGLELRFSAPREREREGECEYEREPCFRPPAERTRGREREREREEPSSSVSRAAAAAAALAAAAAATESCAASVSRRALKAPMSYMMPLVRRHSSGCSSFAVTSPWGNRPRCCSAPMSKGRGR